MRRWRRGAGVPRLPGALLAASAPAGRREEMLGDLEEEYRTRVEPRHGRLRADLWYWGQVGHSILPLLLARLAGARRRGTSRSKGDGAMNELFQDLHYSLRTVRLGPAFAGVVILTLALGIAANTVIFSAVDGVILNPFPYPEPKRLIGVGTVYPKLNRELGFWEVISPPEYREIAAAARALERVVAWDMGHRQLSRPGSAGAPEDTFSAFWWGDAFDTLEVKPALGRGFLPEELSSGSRVAIVSHRLWQTRLGGDPSVVGEPVLVNGEPYTLVGVMPPRALIYGTDLWLPMPHSPEVVPRQVRNFQILARLAPGEGLEAANVELRTIAGRIEQEHRAAFPEYEGWRLEALSWTDINVRTARPAALILMGAVGFVLLLVCVNVASLLLGRAAGRRAEIAVRSALGAGRRRLLSQLLTESLVFGLLGGGVGLLLSALGVRGLNRAMSSLAGLPLIPDIALNARVLLFTAGVTLLSGLLVGVAPALDAARADIAGRLRGLAAPAGVGGPRRLQRLFVGTEVALALVLLVGGGLLVHSFVRLQRVDSGFAEEELLAMRLTLPWERFSGAAINGFFRDLVERVEALPGIEAATFGSQFPPLTHLRSRLSIEGREATGEGSLPAAYTTLVEHDYLETLGMPLLRGRGFSTSAAERSPLEAVINTAAAERYFPHQDAIGSRFKLGQPEADEPWIEIVGVVSAARNVGLDRPAEPEVFISLRRAEGWFNQFWILLRTELDAQTVLPMVEREVSSLDADQPVYNVHTVEQAFIRDNMPRTFATLSMLAFGAFALSLAAVGIYAVASYAVSERAGEIGLRMALGATRRQILAWVVAQAMVPVLVGAFFGLAASIGLGRAMASILYEVSAADPLTLLGATLFFAGVALLATYLPARRATRLDPVATLRSE